MAKERAVKCIVQLFLLEVGVLCSAQPRVVRKSKSTHRHTVLSYLKRGKVSQKEVLQHMVTAQCFCLTHAALYLVPRNASSSVAWY